MRAVGPYVIPKIDKDSVHTTIINELAPESDEGMHVLIDELIPIGDRQCMLVYSSLDFILRKDEALALVEQQELLLSQSTLLT